MRKVKASLVVIIIMHSVFIIIGIKAIVQGPILLGFICAIINLIGLTVALCGVGGRIVC